MKHMGLITLVIVALLICSCQATQEVRSDSEVADPRYEYPKHNSPPIVDMSNRSENNLFSEIFPILATLLAACIGAGFGAWSAYKLQDRVKAREENKNKISSMNQLMFSIFAQLNSLILFQKRVIEPYRNNPGMFLEMEAYSHSEDEDPKYEFPNLAFLLETKYSQLLLELLIEQQRFNAAIKAINYRAELHVMQVQPTLAKAGLKDGIDIKVEDIQKALGALLYNTLKSSTKELVYHVDETVASLGDTLEKTKKIFKELFPGATCLEFLIKDEYKPKEVK